LAHALAHQILSTTLFPPGYERLRASRRIAESDLRGFSQALERARARGVVVLAAAGNWAGIKQKAEQAEWQAASPQQGLYFPASSPTAVAVGCACGDPGQPCEYAHSGSELGQAQIAAVRLAHHYGSGPDFVGYCDGVPSVMKQGTELVYGLSQEGGTSNAVPEVAGVLALAWATDLQAAADTMRQVLQRSAMDLGDPGYDEWFGFGVPNATRAVQIARAAVSTANPFDVRRVVSRQDQTSPKHF
jgi:subtilisin family serine protease